MTTDQWLPELDTPELAPGNALFSDQDGGAIFDQHNVDRALHRYALWRIWDHENRPLVVIGLNPSTATHEVDDPTVRRYPQALRQETARPPQEVSRGSGPTAAGGRRTGR